MPLSVDKALTANYSSYYEDDPAFVEWRRLGGMDKCENILRLCAQMPHASVLDIGCGDGAILQRLAQTGFGSRFTGLEISPSAVRKAQEKQIPNCEVRLFDGYELPFTGQQFDLAVLSHVLEHVEYPRRLIHDAARVARNVFIEVPLEDNWRMPRDFVFDRVGHINFYNPRTIRALVQSCGMTISNEHLCHSSPRLYVFRKGRLRGSLSFWFKESIMRAAPGFATTAMTYHYCLTYRKE